MTLINSEPTPDKKRKSDMYFNDYKCNWCRFKFSQTVGKLDAGKGSSVSDSIVCPKCQNTIKTWE